MVTKFGTHDDLETPPDVGLISGARHHMALNSEASQCLSLPQSQSYDFF